MSKLISICIPTYNRPDELKDCLDSILAATKDVSPDYEFEVVISDNASEESVKNTVNQYCERIPVTYSRNEENIGMIGNLIKSTQMASGEYIWFFSDDDAIKSEGFQTLFATLAQKQASMYFLPRLICDKNLHELGLPPQPAIGNQNVHFADGKTLLNQMTTKIGTIMGFFSSIIIRATDWHDALARNPQDLCEWHHLSTILTAIVNKPITLMSKPFVLCRTNNYRSFKIHSKVWLDDYIRVFLYATTLGYAQEAMAKNISHIMDRQQKAYFKDIIIGKRHQSLKTHLSKLLNGTPFEDAPIHKTKWYYLSFAPAWALRLAFRVATLGRKFD